MSKAVLDGERLGVQQYDNRSNVTVMIETASTGGTTGGAAAAAKRLVADHVAAVIGPQSTREALGSGPVLGAAGIPALTPTVTATSLPSASWKAFLRIVADDQQQGVAEADEMVDTLGRRHVAIVTGPTRADSARMSAAATEIAADGSAVAVSTPTGAEAADRVVASGADGVIISSPSDQARALVSALHAGGFTGSVLVAADADTSTRVLDRLGATADGTLLASPATDSEALAASGNQSALGFRDTFRAAFGRIPPAWAAESYDATEFVLAGLSAGSTTAALLAAYLEGHSWRGVASTLQFAAGGAQLHPHVWMSQIRGGEPTQIGQVG